MFRLFYYKSDQGNFGDDLNAWMWERFFPGAWSDDSKILFSGIGTIIGNPTPPADKVIIFSSGVGYSPIPTDFYGNRFDIRAVRGPLSARVLNVEAGKAVADGALLLSQLPEFAPLPDDKRHGVVFIPHHEALSHDSWREVTERSGLELVDPRWESTLVIQRIRSAKLVVADSMHAAIIADTLRVPWVPVATSCAINTFKWLDWSMSVKVPYRPIFLPAPSAQLAYQNIVQTAVGEAFFVPSLTVDDVMRNFEKTMHARRSIKAQYALLRRKRILNLPFRAMRRLSGSVSLTLPGDARRMEKTVNVLLAAAASQGFLSDERDIGEKTSMLLERINQLRFAYGIG